MRLFETNYRRDVPPSPVLNKSLDEEDAILLAASPDATPASPDENPRKRCVPAAEQLDPRKIKMIVRIVSLF